MSSESSGGGRPAGRERQVDGLGIEVPEGDAADQERPVVDGGGPSDSEVHVPASDPLDRVSDVVDPVNPADAADQALTIDDDEGYDDRR